MVFPEYIPRSGIDGSRVCLLSLFSCVRLFAAPWTVARQAPLSMEFSRQEYWSGLLFPPPGNLSNPGTEPESHLTPALAGRFLPLSHLEDDINDLLSQSCI